MIAVKDETQFSRIKLAIRSPLYSLVGGLPIFYGVV